MRPNEPANPLGVWPWCEHCAERHDPAVECAERRNGEAKLEWRQANEPIPKERSFESDRSLGVSQKYSTIVADPPWHYDRVPASLPSGVDKNVAPGGLRNEPLRYESMTLAEIRALPVSEMSAPDCRLFLWTTNRYLPDAFDVIKAWGFEYRQTLVWHKADGGPFLASVAPNTAEYVLVGTRGKPARTGRISSTVLRFKQNGGGWQAGNRGWRGHSGKPDGFFDLVEQVSPGPYAELFARRARFGWDYPIGDQALGGVAA